MAGGMENAWAPNPRCRQVSYARPLGSARCAPVRGQTFEMAPHGEPGLGVSCSMRTARGQPTPVVLWGLPSGLRHHPLRGTIATECIGGCPSESTRKSGAGANSPTSPGLAGGTAKTELSTIFHPQVQWDIMPGFPSGWTYVGHDTMYKSFFGPLMQHFED